MIFGRPARRSTPGEDAAGGWMFATLAALVFVADAITCLRLQAFAAHPPSVVRVEARIELLALHKRGTILQVETPSGWIMLSPGPANVLGGVHSGIGMQAVTQDAVAHVAWIDAPGNVAHWTVHYPIHLEQSGSDLLHVDGDPVAAVVAAERSDLGVEMAFASLVIVVSSAYALRAQRRERHAAHARGQRRRA